MLKVGELAARAGLTVRTLHHYDSIGLLSPSARSDAGYRLYKREDVARLHQIQALRKFGMALSDIGAYLDRPGASPLAIVEQQLAALDRQIADASRVREQLLLLRSQLSNGEAPELSTWLTTLERMTMYDKYFSKDDLQQLRMVQDSTAQDEWKALVAQVRQAMDARVPPGDESARQLGLRWIAMLERDTGGNPDLIVQLDTMHDSEPSVQHESGISPELKGYILKAIAEAKFVLYAKYLPPAAMEQMRRHQATRAREWPALLRGVKAQMAADPSPHSPGARQVASQWFELFRDMIGSAPDTVAQFRQAVEAEPVLRMGRGMTDEMLAFLRTASQP
ncbi:MAG: MerR family transcriptional regulator [Massilia sp.]